MTEENSVKITFGGHSTVLISSREKRIITDPTLRKRLFFLKRHSKVGLHPSDIKKLDAVLISHLHPDHFDPSSYNYISVDTPIIAPNKTAKKIKRILPNPIIELTEWANHKLSDDINIIAMPAVHSASRWHHFMIKKGSGYIIEIGGKKIFYAGDTAYGSHFKDIGNTYQIDIALLPIGSYSPAFLMKKTHLDPLEAVQAFKDLKAKKMIPIHWGTFRLAFDRPNQSIEWLKKIIEEKDLGTVIEILNPGETFTIN